MNTQAERIKIGQDIVATIRSQVICSNHIIPKEEMPFFNPIARVQNVQRFGDKKYSAFVDYQQKLNEVREFVKKACSEMMENYLSVSALAITEFGVGECHENATLALNHLLLRDKKDVAMVLIKSPKHAQTEKVYHHVFVLFGFKEGMLPQEPLSIGHLNGLSDDVVVIDPYLDCVVPANQYTAQQQKYLKTFGFNQIVNVHAYSSMEKECLAQQQTFVEKVKQRCLALGLKPYFDLKNLEACEDTMMAKAIKASTSLPFQFGHWDFNLHAFAEVKSPEDIEEAKRLQQTLKTGYMHQQSSKSFFVMHNINHQGKDTEHLWNGLTK